VWCYLSFLRSPGFSRAVYPPDVLGKLGHILSFDNFYIIVIRVLVMADVREVIEKVLGGYKDGRKKWGKSLISYKLSFTSDQTQLEPLYYWFLDYIHQTGWKTTKLTDNFMSSPGSGHFSEMGQRASLMQDKGIKLLADVNTVVKAILNLIYDLKEFELRLSHYDDYRSNDKEKKKEGVLALKQLWLDNVDLKRGRGSIHQMSAELGFTTLREAFMIADSVGDLKSMNKDDEGGLINDQVFRVLVPRVNEFLKWADYSEKELRKRMSIEKNYLKSQVENLKLYSAWMKPYIKAAQDLMQNGFEGDAALVNAFSTTMFQLELLGKKKQGVSEKFEDYRSRRAYHPIILVRFQYRGHVSRRVTQRGDYGFELGGRTEVTFDAYSLNSEELDLVIKEMNKDDIAESMNYNGQVAEEALKELKEDLDHFLYDKEYEEKKKEEKRSVDDINPFSAVWDLLKMIFTMGRKVDRKENKKEIEGVGDVKPDNFVEKTLRSDAADSAADGVHNIYDIYKKAHKHASAPHEGFDRTDL